jgi:hypothetical protein
LNPQQLGQPAEALLESGDYVKEATLIKRQGILFQTTSEEFKSRRVQVMD